MNPGSANYLTPDENELLSLVHYHRRQYENTRQRQGGLHPDDIEILKLLDSAEKLLQEITDERKREEEQKLKPVNTQCPNCEVEKERKPIGEEKSEHGYMCNNYHCNECNTTYLDNNPNNAKDQHEWFKEFLAVLEKHKHELDSMPEENKKDILELKDRGEKFKKAVQVEEAALKNVRQAMQQRADAIASWRDYLLVAKVNRLSGNSHTGIN